MLRPLCSPEHSGNGAHGLLKDYDIVGRLVVDLLVLDGMSKDQRGRMEVRKKGSWPRRGASVGVLACRDLADWGMSGIVVLRPWEVGLDRCHLEADDLLSGAAVRRPAYETAGWSAANC